MNLFLVQFLQTTAQGGSSWMQLFPFVLIIVVFYFFMIRPQMKKQKELKKFREALKKGDKVITSGGIYGTVTEIKGDNSVIVEIADNVKVKIDKSAIVTDMSDTQRR